MYWDVQFLDVSEFCYAFNWTVGGAAANSSGKEGFDRTVTWQAARGR